MHNLITDTHIRPTAKIIRPFHNSFSIIGFYKDYYRLKTHVTVSQMTSHPKLNKLDLRFFPQMKKIVFIFYLGLNPHRLLSFTTDLSKPSEIMIFDKSQREFECYHFLQPSVEHLCPRWLSFMNCFSRDIGRTMRFLSLCLGLGGWQVLYPCLIKNSELYFVCF